MSFQKNYAGNSKYNVKNIVLHVYKIFFLGKCKRLWERFIDSARRHKSLFGTTWTALRVMLNSCELKKTYVLNPLAPEFVPRARRKREAYLQKMMSNLQAEALRQPNAYAALMQVILTYSNRGCSEKSYART